MTVSVTSQFITLTVDICVQHGGHEAPRRTGLSAAAETCLCRCAAVDKISTDTVRRLVCLLLLSFLLFCDV